MININTYYTIELVNTIENAEINKQINLEEFLFPFYTTYVSYVDAQQKLSERTSRILFRYRSQPLRGFNQEETINIINKLYYIKTFNGNNTKVTKPSRKLSPGQLRLFKLLKGRTKVA